MNKKIIIPAGIAILVLFGIIGYFLMKPTAKPVEQKKPLTISQDDEDEVIPTAGPEVKATLEEVEPKKEMKLVVDGVPSGTTSIEYDISYDTVEKIPQGTYGTAKPKDDASEFGKVFERQFTLGTCSKNVCRYHNITGEFKAILKFEGSYGRQMLEKQFGGSEEASMKTAE